MFQASFHNSRLSVSTSSRFAIRRYMPAPFALAPGQPAQLQGGVAAAGLRGPGVLQGLAALLGGEGLLLAGRQADGLGAPGPALQGPAPRRLPGGLHGGVDAVAQDGSLLLAAV